MSMEKSFTDNEIIKALEECGCPECLVIRDLINRKNAEIERLQSMNQAKLDTIHDIIARLEVSKSEARKEVAERLDELFELHKTEAAIIWARATMNLLLKEMESESNAE